eukprot:GAHX01000903.1.p1 GENE.GAHX01000903.1~~GAHX01000903.1.p1  ORF type:complete len:430 (-),score=98.99 GAHX01000903.1:28-1260(-)
MDNTQCFTSPKRFNLDDIDEELAQLQLKEIEESKRFKSFKLTPITLSIQYKPLEISKMNISAAYTSTRPANLQNSPFPEIETFYNDIISKNQENDTVKLTNIMDRLKANFANVLSKEKAKLDNPLDSFFNNNAFFNDKKKSSKFSIEELTKLKKLTSLQGKDFDVNNILGFKLSQIPKEIYNIYKPLHLFISESLSSITLLTSKIKKSFSKMSSLFSEELDSETKTIILKIIFNIFVNISTSKIKLHSEYAYAFGYFLILLLDIFEEAIEVLEKKEEKKPEYYKLIFAAYVCGFELKKIEYKLFKEYFLKCIRMFKDENDPELSNECLHSMGNIIRKSDETELNEIIDKLELKVKEWKNIKEKEFFAKKLIMNIEKYKKKEWPTNEYAKNVKDKERINIRYQTVYDGDYN